jgi:hypothetical protein
VTAEIVSYDKHVPWQAHLNRQWTAFQQPTGCTDPMVVRFLKIGNQRKLLDRNARWTGSGWDRSYWVPKAPRVPQRLIDQVVAHMQQQEVTTP